MRVAAILALFMLCAGLACAQEASAEADPFDLSEAQRLVEEYGVPKQGRVDVLGTQAEELFSQGNWAEALRALEESARQANWLANLIVAGLEPYYGASYDDKKGFSSSKIMELATFETLANKYKEKRNHAMVMQAECHVKLGDTESAVSYYYRALDLIGIDDPWWDRARTGLYELIGVR